MNTIETTRNYVPSMSMRASLVKDEITRMVGVYVERLETQLVKWGVTLDDWTIRIAAGSSDGQTERHHTVEDLRSKYRAAQAKLADFKFVAGVRWGTCKLRVEQAENELDSAFQRLRSGFAAAMQPDPLTTIAVAFAGPRLPAMTKL